MISSRKLTSCWKNKNAIKDHTSAKKTSEIPILAKWPSLNFLRRQCLHRQRGEEGDTEVRDEGQGATS